MNYRAEILTPTLIGDGSRLSPIDYMVWRDQVNVLNQARIFRLLAKGQRLETYLAQLRKATKLDFESWGGFAQNYAGRRIPFEDPSCTVHWNKAPVESLSIPAFVAGEAGPYLPGSALKGALRTASGIGPDRIRVVALSDSAVIARDTFRVYLLRVSKLVAKGPGPLSVAWKPGDDFAEMAAPGTVFKGVWRENAFLNSEEVRRSLRWKEQLTHTRLFKTANDFAAVQLDAHAKFAELGNLEMLAASIARLREKLEEVRRSGGCLLAAGWSAGLLSKTSSANRETSQNGLPFPKTRRIVFMKDKPATLAGWLQLTVAPSP